MTAKNTSSSDKAQGALPFGAISESGAASSGTAKKKVARKKTAKKKATKKVAKKASSRRAVAAKAEEPSKLEGGKLEGAKPKAVKPKASRAKPKEKTDGVEATPEPASGNDSGAAQAESNGAGASARKTEDVDQARGDSREGGDGDGKRRRTRRGRRRRRAGVDEAVGGDGARTEETGSGEGASPQAAPAAAPSQESEGTGRSRRRRRRRGKKNFEAGGGGQGSNSGPEAGPEAGPAAGPEAGPDAAPVADAEGRGSQGEGRSGRSRKRGRDDDQGRGSSDAPEAAPKTGSGMFILDKGNVSVLRQAKNGYLPSKTDIYVSKSLVQKHKLRDGMMISGPLGRGYKHKFQLDRIEEIDGQPPEFWKHQRTFKDLTSIDPDFHYAVGDVTDEVSMRIVDLISPIGRGQRGLLVAPPRTGKTTIMRQFAAGIEKGYPDVHLMVLLIDERPEEATEWKRSVDKGEVFVSTADETSKHHIQVAELVWKRAVRLVEMGEDVVLLLDSITRLARAYNNQAGPGRTMSGGLDSRAMERPRKIFGSARNTVEAGSLTILGTTLIETGSKLDQMVFEEFKGTGNMELMLNRKLADRRIFPAIDIARSGTRKEEKIVGMRRLKLIHVLRRVLARMHFTEAAELLITRLIDVEKTDDFLDRFTVDPEA